MLLDDNGLVLDQLDPVLAAILGRQEGEVGCNVVAQALSNNHSKVHPRDWFYCLLTADVGLVRRIFAQDLSREPQDLIDAMEPNFDADEVDVPVTSLDQDTVDDDVTAMLQVAEAIAKEHSCSKVPEPVVAIAFLRTADSFTKSLLCAWLGLEDLTSIEEKLAGKIGARDRPNLFESGGELNKRLLAPSAKQLLDRIVEDAKSLGAEKITTRHLLYSLIGRDSSPLRMALEVRGAVDVKRGMHGSLARELKRPGKVRGRKFELRLDSMFDAVRRVLERSLDVAMDQDELRISEAAIALAFIEQEAAELKRYLDSKQVLDLTLLTDYLRNYQPDEETEKPVHRLSIAEITSQLKQRIAGQDAAIDRVIPWIKRLRFGIPRDNRPAAVFLFLGPTGAGKTQLAKELAQHVYGSEEQLIFVEMGQFQTKESMSGLVGAPPGYVGYGEGILTNGLAEKSEAVVLFDEIEKAHTQVFDALLRFADEGVISDPAGPIRDGSRCIIAFTTNAGQNWLRAHLAAHPEDRENPAMLSDSLFNAAIEELQQKGFRPEFLGRVDERITFLPFTEAACRQIVDGVLDKEIQKFNKLKDVTLEVTPEVRIFLAERAFERSGDEGARGAPRAVNAFIITPAIDLLTNDERPEPEAITIKAMLEGNHVRLEVVP